MVKYNSTIKLPIEEKAGWNSSVYVASVCTELIQQFNQREQFF